MTDQDTSSASVAVIEPAPVAPDPLTPLEKAQADLSTLRNSTKDMFADASNRVLAASAELNAANTARDAIVNFMQSVGVTP